MASLVRPRFHVALSFPGEHRDAVVKPIADALAARLGQDAVLYDHYHDAEFARPNLDIYLPALYREQSELIVPFLCPEYPKKRWCGLEMRHIRQLIETPDAERLMFLSIGDPGDLAELGILKGDGYLDVSRLTAEQAVDKILRRLDLLRAAQPKPVPPPEPAGHVPIDISRIGRYAPEKLIGRENEIRHLDEVWQKSVRGEAHRPRVITYVALGGEGKTSLVAKWLADLAVKDWAGCEAAFAWSFYSQGSRDQATVSSDLFLSEALQFFGNPDAAASAQSAFDKARQLAKLVGDKRAILVLDGLEPLQYPPGHPMGGQLKDQAIAELLKKLAASSKGLCIVTTRIAVMELNHFKAETVHDIPLVGLSEKAGVALLHSLGVHGAEQVTKELVEEVKGHALTLNLLGTFIARAYGGDARQRGKVKFEKANTGFQNGHAFKVIAAYEQWLLESGDEGKREVAVLRIMGLFDRPADAAYVAALREVSISGLTQPIFNLSEEDWNFALSCLQEAKLVTVNRDEDSRELISLDTHPLIREYFADSLRKHGSGTWRDGHRLLYQFLVEHTREGENPTLLQLQPLYQAVVHGCLADLHQEACEYVYIRRILRGNDSYSTKVLGAFGEDLRILTYFFKTPWTNIAPVFTPQDCGFIYHQAGFSLRALGRLSEALQPMKSGLKMDVVHLDWKDASAAASNLSGVEVSLGDLQSGIEDAQRSITFADRSKDDYQRMISRTAVADALHQSGEIGEASKLFEEAERMQAIQEPDYPILYAFSGYRHCDLLLVGVEVCVWKHLLQVDFIFENSEVKLCQQIHERVTKTLQWTLENKMAPLATAFEHLNLGRVALCQSILKRDPTEIAERELYTGVDELRKAGTQEHLPRGLLSRALLLTILLRFDEARSDLDEAYEIAKRGPMPLFLADIHLHRCRLFHAVTPYPWESPQHDLAEARRLIEKHGYWRRREELEDAEQAAKNW